MSESIIEELLAENVELRSKLGSEEIGSIFHVLSTRPMKISGVLISEGVWKGIKYSYDKVLKPSLNKFKGLKGLVMHGKTEEFKDREIGKLTKVACDDLLKAITFQALVTDEEAVKKIEEGVFDAVSVKGKFEDIDMSVTPPEGINYTPIEWSLTGTPACKNCLIFSKEELSRSIESFINQDVPGDKKVNNMSEEEFEVKDNEVLVLPENWDELEDFTEVEAEVLPFEELSKTKKKRKIIRVKPGKYPVRAKKIAKYYGYPYPYYYYPYYYYNPNYEKSLDDLLDLLPLAENYKAFMKKCMNEKKDIKEVTARMKACAMEWKKQSEEESKEEEKEEEIKEEEEIEMAEIKCPVCGEVFKSKKALIKHWNEEHKEKYGEYGQVKKLIKDRALVNKMRKVFELEEEEKEEEETSEEEKEETKEEKKEEEQVEESKEKKEETPEKKEEPKEEEKTEEVTTEEPSTPKEPEKPSLKEIYEKIEKTPEMSAELLIASTKKEEVF